MDKGKTVAILDYADPTIWSGSDYIKERFKNDIIETIPGLSSFNVANALLKRRIVCNGAVIIAIPSQLMDNRAMLETVAKNGATLCIMMGLKTLPELVPLFKGFYPGETPACLVYKAGYSGGEHLIRTTIDGLVQAADGYHEKFLGLIYIGSCLTEKKIPEP